MDAETRKKLEETLTGMLKKADLHEMTEFKLRAAASEELGIDLSSMHNKKLIRNIVESFLLSGAEEMGEGEQVEFHEDVQQALQTAKEVSEGADVEEGTLCKDNSSTNLESIEDHYLKHGKQLPSRRGISTRPHQLPSFKTSFSATEEPLSNAETKLGPQSDEEIKDTWSLIASITPGLFPMEINRFDGNNYHSWAQRMELFLKQLNVSSVLTDPRPIMNLKEDRSSGEVVQIKAAEQKWMNDNYICRRIILSSLSDNLLYKYSQRMTTSKELWEQLKLVYLQEEFGSKRLLVKKYIEFQIRVYKSILEQVQELNQLLDAVEAAGMSIDEKFHVSAIIAKLPPCWKDLSVKLMRSEDLSFEGLMNQIRDEEELQKQFKHKRQQDFLEFQHQKKIGPGSSSATSRGMVGRKRTEGETNGKPTLICLNCGKKGHISRNCWSSGGARNQTRK